MVEETLRFETRESKEKQKGKQKKDSSRDGHAFQLSVPEAERRRSAIVPGW